MFSAVLAELDLWAIFRAALAITTHGTTFSAILAVWCARKFFPRMRLRTRQWMNGKWFQMEPNLWGQWPPPWWTHNMALLAVYYHRSESTRWTRPGQWSSCLRGSRTCANLLEWLINFFSQLDLRMSVNHERCCVLNLKLCWTLVWVAVGDEGDAQAAPRFQMNFLLEDSTTLFQRLRQVRRFKQCQMLSCKWKQNHYHHHVSSCSVMHAAGLGF